jgi:hypothetical protein
MKLHLPLKLYFTFLTIHTTLQVVRYFIKNPLHVSTYVYWSSSGGTMPETLTVELVLFFYCLIENRFT